jgi:peptidoglycan/LPS O-acetylase OafA/YrhL
MSKSSRIPALDGMRAIAVLLVVGHHTHFPEMKGGFVGVDIFFVLSGYLITGILLEELKGAGSIDLKNFYRRRFCRLTPPLVLLVAAYWICGGGFAFGLWALLYVTDWMPIDLSNPLNHTWSLAIEEQFYLLWPVALLGLRRLKAQRMIALLAGLYVLATVWRVVVSQSIGPDVAYFRFDTRLSGLVLGSLLAVILAEQPQRLAGIAAGRWGMAVGVGFLALLPFLR